MKNNFDWSCDQLNQKATYVNKELEELYLSNTIRYIDHTNIYPRKHLNQSRLYFNYHDNTILFSNICKGLRYWQHTDCCYEVDGNFITKRKINPNDWSNCSVLYSYLGYFQKPNLEKIKKDHPDKVFDISGNGTF